MPKFRVVIAVSYDVEAENEVEAETIAHELLEKEIGKEALDAVLEVFGVNVRRVEDEEV